CASSDGGDYW
nr:immunoglobulin heavy chain junction region [Mus musculus]